MKFADLKGRKIKLVEGVLGNELIEKLLPTKVNKIEEVVKANHFYMTLKTNNPYGDGTVFLNEYGRNSSIIDDKKLRIERNDDYLVYEIGG